MHIPRRFTSLKLNKLVMAGGLSLLLLLSGTVTLLKADVGGCGGVSVTLPFADVAGNAFFCQIAAAYFSGLANGTTPTTYSPANNVTREQMAAFITRTLDQSLERGSRRAALDQWATPGSIPPLTTTAVGAVPMMVKSDGEDLWVANNGSGTVSRVHASDGRLLGTWTGATAAYGVVIAKGRVFITGDTNPGSLYVINPALPPGPVTLLSNSLGNGSRAITSAGYYLWTANAASVSKVDPLNGVATTFSTNFNAPRGITFDGSNVWVTDTGGNTLKKLDEGGVAQTINLSGSPGHPIFDGTNIWVPIYFSSALTVVRAATGAVVANLTGNGLNNPLVAAFDGERVLVTNNTGLSVSLWKAADLTPLGSALFSDEGEPVGACSNGINFWITLQATNKLARF